MPERQAETDKKAKVRPEPERAAERTTAAEPAVGPASLPAGASPQLAGALGDRRLPRRGRQALAIAAGRTWGNRRLQRVLATRIQRNPGLADLSEAERQRIQVVTADIAVPDLHSLFSTEVARTRIPLPTGATPEYGGAIADDLQPGLSNVAGRLIQNRMLPLNATTTLVLNLTAYGGDSSAYRFTYVERIPAEGEQATRQVLIERLGPVTAEGLTDEQRAAQQQRFTQHGFVRGGGWSESDFGVLLEGVAELPDGLLAPVNGLTFQRAATHPTDPQAGGAYDPMSHTVTMYDRAFAGSLARFGTPAGTMTSPAARAVVHEIGHAIDLLPLRQAWGRLAAAENTLRTAFRQWEDPDHPGQYNFPSTEQANFDRLMGEITAAEAALPTARSASGYAWQLGAGGDYEMVEGGTAAGTSAFRQAAQQDGSVRVTEYSDREWQEYYAESFSLYHTDPTTLQQLRPHVYQYFVTHPQG